MTNPPEGEQPGYQPAYGQPVYWTPPKHQSADTAMVLGIVAVGGGMVCGLPIVLAPFAWATGARAVREIDASGGRLGGRSEANAGKVLGIVGTVLLGIGVLFVAAYLIFMASIVGGFSVV